jgi:ubiquitin-protein ligase E3 C
MFDGNHRSLRREVNLSGKRNTNKNNANNSKQRLLEQSRARREERRIATERAVAATRVQCRQRGNMDRHKLLRAWTQKVNQGCSSSNNRNATPSPDEEDAAHDEDSVTRVLDALFRLSDAAPFMRGEVTHLLPIYANCLRRKKALSSSSSQSSFSSVAAADPPPPFARQIVLATLREAKDPKRLSFEDIREILMYLLNINATSLKEEEAGDSMMDCDYDTDAAACWSQRMGVQSFDAMIGLLCEESSSSSSNGQSSQLQPFLRQCIARILPAGSEKDAVSFVLGLAFGDLLPTSSGQWQRQLEAIRTALAQRGGTSSDQPLLLLTIVSSRQAVRILVAAAALFLREPTVATGAGLVWLLNYSLQYNSTMTDPVDQSLIFWALNRLARGDGLQEVPVTTDSTMNTAEEEDDDDSDEDENDVATRGPARPDAASSSAATTMPRRVDRQELSTVTKLDRYFSGLTKQADQWYADHYARVQPDVEKLANPQLWHQLGLVILTQGSEDEQSNYIILLFMVLQSLTSATSNRSSLSSQLLNKLSFSLEFIERVWAFLETKMATRSYPHTWSHDFIAGLSVFATIMSHYLVALRDEQFIARHTKLPITSHSGTEQRSVKVEDVIDIYNEILGHLYLEAPVYQSDFQLVLGEKYSDPPIAPFVSWKYSVAGQAMRAQLMLTGTKLFKSLHNRWTRLVVSAPFCDESLWWIDSVVKTDRAILDSNNNHDDMDVDGEDQSDLADSFRDPKVARLMSAIPMVVPFHQRVELFQSLLNHEKIESQNSLEEATMAIEAMIRGEEPRRSARVKIHRDRLFEDSMEQLNALGKRMKQKIQVAFVNRHGAAEAGIDGGGVFREFIDDLIHEAFLEEGAGHHRPKLFTVTPHQTLMINTDIEVSELNLTRFEFLGRVLGKALYESILVDPQFCLPFLNQLLGKSNSLDDLKNLDAEYYSNLVKLLTMPVDDLEGLGLVFEASVGTASARSVELVPNGKNIAVNKQNVISYVHLVANMKLNVETSRQTKAFMRGFRDLIPSTWVRLFSAHELQKLISGDDSLRGFDVAALKRSMQYAAGYHPDQEIIQWFWEVLEELSTEQKHLFLKFMTSCSRQPLLGFDSLEPAPCVQQIRLPETLFERGNMERLAKESPLPTSATCMNLLKLPNYRSKELLKHKLLAAIESGSGFELT